MADRIDENKAADLAIVAIGLEHQRAIEAEMGIADLVGLQRGGALLRHGVDGDAVLERRDHRA